MKKILALLIATLMLLSAASALAEGKLVYGSGDYTRINPAIDEHGEINLLIFNGLTAHDADDHPFKVFGTDQGNNYSGYSNPDVDAALLAARSTFDTDERARAYADFQVALANDPAYTFFCYIDADYVVDARVKGITADTVLGHHGVGIFWNVAEWTLEG